MTGPSSSDVDDASPGTTPRRAGNSPGLAVLTAVVQVVGTVVTAHGQSARLDLFGYTLLIVSGLALTYRYSHPRTTLAIVTGATLIYHLRDFPGDLTFLALAFAVIAVEQARRHGLVWMNAVIWYTAWVVLSGATFGRARSLAFWIVGLVLLTEAVVAAILFISRMMREQERLRKEQRLRAAGEERLRIAHELHDVLGHHLSLINVRAGIGLHLMDRRPDQARAALDTIKQASAEALREVQSVINALHPAGQAAPRAPAPGLGQLDELTLDAGLPVRTAVVGDPRSLPPEIDLAAYRIVQEALTNVRRHADAGATADIVIEYRTAELIMIQVDDDGGGPRKLFDAPLIPADGNGIGGMRERARALGGTLTAGPLPTGGWRVQALLPLPADVSAPESSPMPSSLPTPTSDAAP